MSLDRREFMKIGAIGLASTYVAGCNRYRPKGGLHVRFRGLCLLEGAPKRMTVHLVDAQKLSLPEHSAVLRVRPSALDRDNTSDPDRKDEEGQATTETWVWNLAGKQVSILDQASDPDELEFDTSTIPASHPAGTAPMNSTKWIPDLKTLTGATKRVRDDAYNCQIVLKRGRIEGAEPKTKTWRKVTWTFKNSGQVVLEQSLTDTVLYRCALNGRAPVIKVGSKTITLCGCPSEYVSIENFPAKSEVVDPEAPFTLGHFTSLYGLVDKAFVPDVTADPPSRKDCATCEDEPIFCPPGRI